MLSVGVKAGWNCPSESMNEATGGFDAVAGDLDQHDRHLLHASNDFTQSAVKGTLWSGQNASLSSP